MSVLELVEAATAHARASVRVQSCGSAKEYRRDAQLHRCCESSNTERVMTLYIHNSRCTIETDFTSGPAFHAGTAALKGDEYQLRLW